MALVTVAGVEYAIEDRLKPRWDKIRNGKLAHVDEDRVYVVDGREGCGKSVFALQQAAYLDPSIINDPSRITFSAEETLNAIRKTKSNLNETKAIIFDEAFRGLSSRSAISKTNKQIIQALMEMRQNNLVLFIVLPSFFMLDMYAAVSRSHALFHIKKEQNTKKRAFYVYNYRKKAKLYSLGLKKGWNYHLYTEFKGRFSGKYPGGDAFEQAYRDLKLKAFQNTGLAPVNPQEEPTSDKIKSMNRKNLEKAYLDLQKLITNYMIKEEMSDQAMVDWLKSYGIERSPTGIGIIRRDFLEKQGNVSITQNVNIP